MRIIIPYLNTDAGDPGISVIPSRNQTVAITSNENITYECVVDGGRSAFWSVQNNPLEGDHINQFESIGIYKQDSPQGNSSVLIVSQRGREAYRNTSQDIRIRCRAFKESPPESAFSDSFYIISYGESFVHARSDTIALALFPILSLRSKIVILVIDILQASTVTGCTRGSEAVIQLETEVQPRRLIE